MRRLLSLIALPALLATNGLTQVAKPPAGSPPKTTTKKSRPDPARARKPALPYRVGDRVDPNLSLTDIDGKVHRLRDYRGKIVLLDFWSIQCPISKGYEERLIAIFDAYANKGVVVLALDANNREVRTGAKKPFARIRKYVRRAKVPYPVLIDKDSKVADSFAARTTPHVFILDAKGRLAYAGGIDDDFQWNVSREQGKLRQYARDALDDLLAGREVRKAKTRSWGCSIKRPRKAAGRRGTRRARRLR